MRSPLARGAGFCYHAKAHRHAALRIPLWAAALHPLAVTTLFVHA